MDNPVTLVEKQLDEIIKLLKDMKPQNIPQSVNDTDLKNTQKKEVKSEGKVCKYCGKVHNKPIEYAICAKRNKKG